jgi:hypothetical protein
VNGELVPAHADQPVEKMCAGPCVRATDGNHSGPDTELRRCGPFLKLRRERQPRRVSGVRPGWIVGKPNNAATKEFPTVN